MSRTAVTRALVVLGAAAALLAIVLAAPAAASMSPHATAYLGWASAALLATGLALGAVATWASFLSPAARRRNRQARR